MKVESSVNGEVLIIKVFGKVVGDDALQLRRDISGLIANIPGNQKPKIAIDLSGVSMIDVCGLGVLISTYTAVAKREGKIVLVLPSPNLNLNSDSIKNNPSVGIANLISITKLNRIFDIFESEKQAIENLLAV